MYPAKILVKILVQKARALTYIITSSVTASVEASGVRLSVGTNNGERLRLFEGEGIVIP